MFPSSYTNDAQMMLMAMNLGVMACIGIDGAPGRVATVILEPSETRPPMQIPIFISFMVMGLFQPFFDFVVEILRTYRLGFYI